MSSGYPRYITVLILLISAAGAGMGMTLQPAASAQGSDSAIDTLECESQLSNETRQIVDNSFDIKPGERQQFTYKPGDADRLQIKLRTVAGESPTLMIKDAENRNVTMQTAINRYEESFPGERSKEYTLVLSNADGEYTSTMQMSVAAETQREVSNC